MKQVAPNMLFESIKRRIKRLEYDRLDIEIRDRLGWRNTSNQSKKKSYN